MALRRQMEIFARPALPQPLLTIARQSGDTPPPPLAPGATLSAQVQGTAADGTLTLAINDRVLKVASDLQLVQGTRINVKVEQREGQLVLRLLTPPGETPRTPQQALRQILPRQQPLQPLFTQLARLVSSGATISTTPQTVGQPPLTRATLATTLPATASGQTALPTLPAGVRQAIGSLLNLLPNNEKLATPEGLKQALHNSGMFFESRLLQGDAASALQGDLKTLLFRIAFLVRQTLEGLPPLPHLRPTTAPRQGEESAPRDEHSDAGTQQGTAKERQAATAALLQLLGRQSESSLARVQMNQLSALQAQQQGEEVTLTLELPLFSGKESEVVQLQIRRETKQGAGEAETCWSVTLKLDNEEYGVIRAVVSLAAGKVATTFWCEQPQTQQHFAQHLEELRQRLREQGLEPGQTQAFGGQPAPTDTPHGTRHNDHLINTRA